MTSTSQTARFERRFATPVPLYLLPEDKAIKCEIKPYLQPFEMELAVRELRTLIGKHGRIEEKFGFHLVYSSVSESMLRRRLTYWQRVGKTVLYPTAQKALEFTQNGVKQSASAEALHHARRLRYGPHDIHDYRGKFFPQLVHALINIAGADEADVVLDPMCGSGTTTCEALAAGFSSLGIDLNPLSVLISQVKASLVLEKAEVFRKSVTGYLTQLRDPNACKPEHHWSAEDIRYLRRWFSPEALADVASLLATIEDVRKPVYRNFFRVCLSNIIRSVSWQKEVDLRVRKETKPYSRGTAVTRFIAEVEQQLDRIYPYLCLLPRSPSKLRLEVAQGDATDLVSLFPAYRRKISLLITSPPYATALPYLDTDRLSLITLKLLPRAEHASLESRMVGTREVSERQRAEAWQTYVSRKRELPISVSRLIDDIAEYNHLPGVGFRRRNLPALLGQYYLAMLDAMRSAHALMAPRAQGYYIVGNNSTEVSGTKIEIPTDRFLFEIGSAAGWKQREMIPMELLASRDIFRENRGTTETILCFNA